MALQPWRTDYLIGASYLPALGGVALLAGTIECVPLPSPLLRRATNGLHARGNPAHAHARRGDVAVINTADPQRWVLEQVLSGKTSPRAPGTKGHRDIVRTAQIDPEVRSLVSLLSRSSAR